ncbi:glycosyltransferase family 4 protein [Fibrobacter sp.]
MKKILFDLTKTQPVDGSKYHGGGKYGIEVFKKLTTIDPEKIVAYYDDSRHIEQPLLELCREKQIPLVKKNAKDILTVAKENNAVLYSPLFDPAYLRDSSIWVIVTIHGLRVLELPSDNYEAYYTSKQSTLKRLISRSFLYKFFLARKRNRVYKKNLCQKRQVLTSRNLSFITVSNHSKYSLLTFIPNLDSNTLKVFYSPSTVNDSVSLENCKNIYGKYYLIVSGNRWVKNSIRAIIALDELFSEHPEIEGIVVVTGISNKSEIAIDIKNLNRFVFVGYVDELRLKGLYHNAYLFVYPSLNEGFGYPPLEAMHEGCPVIASAIASIPEVCGDAVMYFNPFSIPEIKMRMMEMENSSTRLDYIKRGLIRQKEIQMKQDEDLTRLAEYILSFTKNRS